MRTSLRVLGSALLAAAISVAITAIWSALLATNLASTPRLPWSVFVMSLVLALAWRALSGGVWRAHAAARSELLPRRCHSPAHRAWASAAAIALMCGAFAATVLAIRLALAPIAPVLPRASEQPLLAGVYLAMASLVAGVAEEAGFRGVMQSLLVRLVSLRSAIALVAVAFAALHVGNPEFAALAPIYLVSSIGLSLVVSASGSLWPAICAHALADFLSYTLLLAVGAEPLRSMSPAWQAATAGTAALSLAAAALALRRLHGLRGARP
jgi:membrane protease YdiL (CAAX protease family)